MKLTINVCSREEMTNILNSTNLTSNFKEHIIQLLDDANLKGLQTFEIMTSDAGTNSENINKELVGALKKSKLLVDDIGRNVNDISEGNIHKEVASNSDEQDVNINATSEDIDDPEKDEEQEEENTEKLPNLDEKQDAKNKNEKEETKDFEEMTLEERQEMRYLNADRLIETAQRTSTWQKLNPELQNAIISAYRSTGYSEDYQIDTFLETRVGNYLPQGESAALLKDFHKAVILGTAVGVYTETLNRETGEKVAGTEESQDTVKVVDMATLSSEMPEGVKDWYRKDLYQEVEKIVRDILVNTPKSDHAILLTPFEAIVDKAIDNKVAKEGIDSNSELKKAYLISLRDDATIGMERDFPQINMALALNTTDRTNKDAMRQVENVIQNVDRESDGTSNLPPIIGETEIIVRNSNDIETIKNLQKMASQQGQKFQISFAVDADAGESKAELMQTAKELGPEVIFDQAMQGSIDDDYEAGRRVDAMLDAGMKVATAAIISSVNPVLGIQYAHHANIGEDLANGFGAEDELHSAARAVSRGEISKQAAIEELSQHMDKTQDEIDEELTAAIDQADREEDEAAGVPNYDNIYNV